MKKEILPQYIYREKSGSITNLKDYYSLDFESDDERYYYIWENTPLQESIFLCNRNLFKELLVFYKKSPKKKKRLLRTLENYFIRFCTRPSSFFTFGYVEVGRFSDGRAVSNLEYKSKNKEKIADVSTEWAFSFFKLILKNRDVLNELVVFSNPNLVEVGTKLLNQDLHFNQTSSQKIFLTDLNEILSEVIEKCTTNLKIRSLVNLLLEKGFDIETVYDYIFHLIDSEILLLECFEILIKDNKINLIESFVNEIESMPAELQRNISQINSKIDQYCSISLGEGTKVLTELYNLMDNICEVRTPLNILYISRNVSKIDYQIKNRIEELLNILLRINLKYKRDSSLEEYGRRFYNIYGINNLVPLKELLSIKNLGSPSNYSNPILSTYKGESLTLSGGLKQFQQDLVNLIFSTPKGEAINLENLIEQGGETKEIFPTAEMVFSIFESDDRVKLKWQGSQYSDNFFSISGKYAPHFKDFLDTNKMLEIEKQYYGNSIIGIDEFNSNLVLNDIKRENFIDSLVLDLPFWKNVNISDLYIYLDEHNNFKAYSKKIKNNIHILKRNRISPNLLNNQIRFLYSIFCNKLSYYDFHKALSVEYLHYQNRIVFKDIIVFPKTWRMSKNTNFEKFIKRYSVPMLVNLVDGDMELLINLNKVEDIEKVKQALRKDRVVLTEYLGKLDDSKELIVFTKDVDSSLYVSKAKLNLEECQQISEEWFNFHLYCKEELASLIIENILNEVLSLLDNNIKHSINFVQYYQDEYHIRFRIKILRTASTYRNKLLIMILNLFTNSINDGLLLRFEMLPYRSDFTSFGGSDNAIEIEQIMTLDSTYIISNYLILRKLPLQHYVIFLQNTFKSFGIGPEELIKYFEDIKFPRNYSLYRDVKKEIKDIDLNSFPSSQDLLMKFNYLASLTRKIESKRELDMTERIEVAKNYTHHFLNKIFFNKIYEEKIYQIFYLYLVDKVFVKSKNI